MDWHPWHEDEEEITNLIVLAAGNNIFLSNNRDHKVFLISKVSNINSIEYKNNTKCTFRKEWKDINNNIFAQIEQHVILLDFDNLNCFYSILSCKNSEGNKSQYLYCIFYHRHISFDFEKINHTFIRNFGLESCINIDTFSLELFIEVIDINFVVDFSFFSWSNITTFYNDIIQSKQFLWLFFHMLQNGLWFQHNFFVFSNTKKLVYIILFSILLGKILIDILSKKI